MKQALLTTRLSSGLAGLLLSTTVLGAGEVSSVIISEQPATPYSYSAGGIDYNWGAGNNQIIEGFTANGLRYGFASVANEVVVRRDDIGGIASGEPCGVFVERTALDANSRTYAADFPSDGSVENTCELEEVLNSRIVNRGVVDVFSNTLPDAKNIERLDYLFYSGALAPLSEDQLNLAGHLVAEKRGNNPIQLAAILALDALGQPAAYGPLVLVSAAGCTSPDICYGATDLSHTYSFLQNELNAPQSFPVETERSVEIVNMAFVSAADLGLTVGQRYYGISFFADDVDESVHDLVDPTSFPDNTSDDYVVVGDDADLYGGLTGYFLADDANLISGSLFLDKDTDGTPDADEAGVGNVTLSLYQDVDGNGMLDPAVDNALGDSLMSNIDGSFVFPGVSDGNYLVMLDEEDPEIPAGLVVTPGLNPFAVSINGTDSDPINFSFISESNTGSGSLDDDPDGGATGGDTAGATGGDTAGTTGGDTAGTTGGETAGSTGGETAGTTGGDTAGATGGDTAGTTGGDTAGTTGGDTAGTTGGDTAGTTGGDTAGTTGGDTAGTTGGDTAGTTGGDTAGTTGGDTAGTTGGDTAGTTGGDTAGTTGGETAGTTDGDTAGTTGGETAGTTGGETAGTTGGDTAGTTGGETAGTTGGDTAGTTGGETAGTTGGETAGTTGGETAGTTGGETAGTTGGETAGTTGGETAGTTDGDTAGTTGGDTAGTTGGDTAGTTGGDTAGNTGGETDGATGGDTGNLSNDDATAANSDEFHIIQGRPTILDVLDNDEDGAGDGLVIVSLSESSNAQISITDDNKVLYQPEYGYYSPQNDPDTFTYTLEDGDGDQRTGNVSVNVMRSDLNGNQLDDFFECDCDDLFLETGVNGSGIGNLSTYTVLSLILVYLLRLQRSSTAKRLVRERGV